MTTIPSPPIASPTRATALRGSRVAARQGSTASHLPWPVTLFLISLVLPWIMPIGPLTMPIYRLVLLLCIVPCMIRWVTGHAGPIRVADVLFILYALWIGASLTAVHGIAGALEPFGALFIETVGAYLLARTYVHDAETFGAVVTFMLKLLAVLLPFGLVEWITGAKPLLTILGAIMPTVEITQMTPRLGLWRVQGPFAHSIEYGAFCGSLVVLATLVAGSGRSALRKIALGGFVAFTAILSMSSAPIAGVAIQGLGTFYDRTLKHFSIRWYLLLAIAFLFYLVIEFGSNQTPIQFYISYFTFDQQTGWYRMWIWEYGSASVANHPLFGIGLNDWERPRWMPANSIDTFWLLTAMRYGVPALVLFMLGMVGVMVPLARMKFRDERIDSYRLAYLMSMAAFIFVGTTVHFWGALYCWFLFLLGCGTWFREYAATLAANAARRAALIKRYEKQHRRPARDNPVRHGSSGARHQALPSQPRPTP